MSELLKQAPLVISTLALLMSVATFWRAGKWKESDGAKELVTSISANKKEIDKELGTIKAKLAEHEIKFENIATKADIARIEAEIRGLDKVVNNMDSAVVRIEAFLMKDKK